MSEGGRWEGEELKKVVLHGAGMSEVAPAAAGAVQCNVGKSFAAKFLWVPAGREKSSVGWSRRDGGRAPLLWPLPLVVVVAEVAAQTLSQVSLRSLRRL